MEEMKKDTWEGLRERREGQKVMQFCFNKKCIKNEWVSK